MKPGDIVCMSKFSHETPNMKVSFAAPKGKTVVFLYLGHADKKFPEDFDPDQALINLGWTPPKDRT